MVGHNEAKTTQRSMFEPLKKLALDYLVADTPPLTPGARWQSFVGALLGLLLAGIIVYLAPDGGVRFLPPMGASAIILFALPHSPLAQPWSVLGGCLAASVSALLAAALPVHTPKCRGLAVAATLWLMIRFRCLHPPGGALTMLIAIEGARPPLEALQLIGVAVANVFAMLLAAWTVNNFLLRWRYPQCRSESTPSLLHGTADLAPTERTGLAHDDLDHAVQAVGTFVDIQEHELVQIYNLAVDRGTRVARSIERPARFVGKPFGPAPPARAVRAADGGSPCPPACPPSRRAALCLG
jgi:CBS domain-containing membrane protein